jgi:hypothetical protein
MRGFLRFVVLCIQFSQKLVVGFVDGEFGESKKANNW